jgi:hypothetical protein
MNNPKPKYRVSYCPYDGCGMSNGAAREYEVKCKCGSTYGSFSKLCPTCHVCKGCGRLGKKFSGG